MTPIKSTTTDPAALSSQVDALLADLAIVRRYLAEIPGPPSNAGIALDAARSGVIGDGCSVHVPRGHERLLRTVRVPLEYRRLWDPALVEMPGHTLRTWLVSSTEVLNLDECKVAPLVLAYDPENPKAKLTHELDLRERIAWTWSLHDAAKRAQWERGLRSGDSRAARQAMQAAGAARLNACAEEWCR